MERLITRPVGALIAFVIGMAIGDSMLRTATAQGSINCLSSGVVVRWNPACKQEQNWWYKTGAQAPLFFYYDPWLRPPQDLKWSIDKMSWARIHDAYGKIDPNTGRSYKKEQLAYYPDRAATDSAAQWTNGVSGLELVKVSSGRVQIIAKEAHKYTHNTRNSFAHTDYRATYKASQCGDGAQARCYKKADVIFNGGYGWLPTRNASATLCCYVSGTHSGPTAPSPPSHIVGWWGVSGLETTMVHEFGHAAGLWHAQGSGCPTYSPSRMMQKAHNNSPTCSDLGVTMSDVIALRYLYGHP